VPSAFTQISEWLERSDLSLFWNMIFCRRVTTSLSLRTMDCRSAEPGSFRPPHDLLKQTVVFVTALRRRASDAKDAPICKVVEPWGKGQLHLACTVRIHHPHLLGRRSPMEHDLLPIG
jgi:hypothetical protein